MDIPDRQNVVGVISGTRDERRYQTAGTALNAVRRGARIVGFIEGDPSSPMEAVRIALNDKPEWRSLDLISADGEVDIDPVSAGRLSTKAQEDVALLDFILRQHSESRYGLGTGGKA